MKKMVVQNLMIIKLNKTNKLAIINKDEFTDFGKNLG